MIAYLESAAAPKPKTIAEAPEQADPTRGRVTANIRHGDLFLHPVGHRQDRLRLRWEAQHDGTRELPAGTYKVSGYRHVARAKDGAQWIWSTASPAYREIEVKAGETFDLDVRQKIHVRARAFTKNGKHRVGLVFEAEARLGNTLYRDGKRIDITWQCLDAKGQVLAEGPMRYG